MTEVHDIDTTMRMVKNGKFYFITERSYFSTVSAEDCNLVIAKEEFFPTDYGWAFPKATPFIKKFNDR